jgi:hypothetical protein
MRDVCLWIDGVSIYPVVTLTELDKAKDLNRGLSYRHHGHVEAVGVTASSFSTLLVSSAFTASATPPPPPPPPP